MPVTCANDGQHCYYEPKDRKARDEDAPYDREEGKAGCVRQRQRRQRVNAEWEGKSPTAEIEWHAISQIPRSFQYREQKPPSAISP
jgi:hypothetical protein